MKQRSLLFQTWDGLSIYDRKFVAFLFLYQDTNIQDWSQSRPVHRGRIIILIIIIIIGDDCGLLYNGTKHARHGR